VRVEFYELKFDLTSGWADITDDLPEGSPPTLARPSGAGALQFSIAKYRSGDKPHINIEDLRKFLEAFCDRNSMPRNDIVDCSHELISIKTEAVVDGELLVARYTSNGRDVLLSTYVCPNINDLEMNEDLKGVEQILNSIEL
jgi:hypothetical protein